MLALTSFVTSWPKTLQTQFEIKNVYLNNLLTHSRAQKSNSVLQYEHNPKQECDESIKEILIELGDNVIIRRINQLILARLNKRNATFSRRLSTLSLESSIPQGLLSS